MRRDVYKLRQKHKTEHYALNRIMCPIAVKQKHVFETKSKAMNFIKLNANKMDYPPIRAYYCYACNGWHVTSKKRLIKPTPQRSKNIPL
jgi:hypothetical protein